MSSLYYYSVGKGNHNLMLLHGWGLNAEIWQIIVAKLSLHLRLHLLDLPGFSRSKKFGPLTLPEMAQILLPYLPSRTILLGWSLGGLVATQIALTNPQSISALISVASSPCFTARDNWPGIKPITLQVLQKQLANNFHSTIERFLMLQVMGAKNTRKDIYKIKDLIFAQPISTVEVLESGLKILKNTDLRPYLPKITIPFLRIYGSLDVLVPRKICNELDTYLPTSSSIVMDKTTHAPFISHPEIFCRYILDFIKSI
ncbi:pimeloyl-ACP methyl ester esterase BioH [Pantoea sp. Aalb]|uniref:pimeloyl-ACP methyl ester esterase BioH n=1 Tax=Pantoea sp. Aalb TaxID=2576762 RepID=UPI00132BD9FA|nr:pimeloyl-ACP methyl ester esterase BioH [Pantoea sp. Aalb]MXP67860.1 pimeloyl-ACP methyl ester esterase BioH [Pantoea sp. Aalb]